MAIFSLLVAALFFLLGGAALAVPWRGVVALVEVLPRPAGPDAERYVLLLVLPVTLLAAFVLALLGPWDAAVCRDLHEACLGRVAAWHLPAPLAWALGATGLIAGGRLARPYLAARLGRRPVQGELTGIRRAQWARIEAEVESRCDARLPPLFVLAVAEPVCRIEGLWRTRLCVSESLLIALDHDELVGAICHEMAHVRRWDLAVGSLAYMCHCALFFMPAGRRCYARYLEEREIAADDWAIARTGKPLALASALAKVGAEAGGDLLNRRLARLLAGASTPRKRGVLGRLGLLGAASVLTAALLDHHHAIEAWSRGVLTLFGVL